MFMEMKRKMIIKLTLVIICFIVVFTLYNTHHKNVLQPQIKIQLSSKNSSLQLIPSQTSSAPPLQTTLKNGIEKCKIWNFSSEVKAEENTKIKLNPKMFLYPGLIWGPNNQILGLQHCLYLAIRLNRTIVVPKFHAQWNHPGNLDPHEFIDVKRLCSFVSCISIDRLREECDGSFDVAFESMPNGGGYLQMHEQDTKMSVIHPKRVLDIPYARKLRIGGQKSELPALPHDVYLKKYGETMPMDPSILQTAFDTTAPCAIYSGIFDPLHAYPRNGIAAPLQNNPGPVSEIFDDVLYSAVLDAIQHPPAIIEAAKNYIRDVLDNQPYIGVHWRYDPGDWIARLCSGFIFRRITERCKKVKQLNPSHVAKAIHKHFPVSLRSQKTVPVYIATPTTLEEFRNNIYVELNKIDEKFVRPEIGVRDYLIKTSKPCWINNKWNNIESVISLTEMEIMKFSSVYYFSPESTWSDKVRQHRVEINKDGEFIQRTERDVMDLAFREI